MTASRNPDTPDDSSQLDQEIADLLVFSVWELREAANRAFEPLDLTVSHVAILNFIANDPQLRSGDLAERLGLSRVRTSSLLTQLEKQGLLERSTPQSDRRGRNIALTKMGEALRLEANGLWKAVTVNRYTRVSQSDKEVLLRLLRDLHAKNRRPL